MKFLFKWLKYFGDKELKKEINELEKEVVFWKKHAMDFKKHR